MRIWRLRLYNSISWLVYKYSELHVMVYCNRYLQRGVKLFHYWATLLGSKIEPLSCPFQNVDPDSWRAGDEARLPIGSLNFTGWRSSGRLKMQNEDRKSKQFYFWSGGRPHPDLSRRSCEILKTARAGDSLLYWIDDNPNKWERYISRCVPIVGERESGQGRVLLVWTL